MKIAVEGCAHGCLDEIYSTIRDIENKHGMKIDLLLCCGDFQSLRNLHDLKTMSCPNKYKEMGSFYKYYSGQLVAPVLTIFIGGNHEASNYLQELPYGGWVAPKIYYLGYSGVIRVGGLRIGGLSGIFKAHDYMKGRYECPPYDFATQKSVYHVRNLDTFRLKQLYKNPPDILLSHDWPSGVYHHGNCEELIRRKPYFKESIENGKEELGSGPAREVLNTLKPKFWFSGHLHVKFPALIRHENGSETKFLALDKCLPRRRFLQILEIDDPRRTIDNDETELTVRYDQEWLAILKSTNHLLTLDKSTRHMPGPGYPGRHDFSPSNEELKVVDEEMEKDYKVPMTMFVKIDTVFNPSSESIKRDLNRTRDLPPMQNPQTVNLCRRLKIDDPIDLLLKGNWNKGNDDSKTFNEDEIILDDDDDDDDDDDHDDKNDDKKVDTRKHLELPPPLQVHTQEVQQDNFFIDTTSLKDEETSSSSSPPPAKRTLKRRNKAIYSSDP